MMTHITLGAIDPVVMVGGVLVFGFLLLLMAPLLSGVVLIRERQVGVVVKRFSSRSLAPGQFIALSGEAGYQADTLAPGLHFGFWRWQYRIQKVPVTMVPQGEIALVLAALSSTFGTSRKPMSR